MHRRSVAIAIGILVAVVGADNANARSDSLPSRVSAPPVFNVPLVLPPATAGTKYTYRFCDPVTAKGCGGPLARNQVNPSLGSGGPYAFKIQLGSGFVPKGLVLSSRTGILTGIVATTAAKDGTPTLYNFTVCVSDRSGTTCRPTQLTVEPKPAPGGVFVGKWTGTYTRISTTQHLENCPDTVNFNGAASVTIIQTGDRYTVDISFAENYNLGCKVKYNYNFGAYLFMNHASPTTITGTFSNTVADYALTLTGPNTIIGTGMGSSFGRVEFMLNRG